MHHGTLGQVWVDWSEMHWNELPEGNKLLAWNNSLVKRSILLLQLCPFSTLMKYLVELCGLEQLNGSMVVRWLGVELHINRS